MAALGLLVAMVPAATATAAAAASPAVAGPNIQVTFIQTLCPGYTVVPANKTPNLFDQTGHWQELDTSYQTNMVDPSTDIPSVCTRADGWQFQIYADAGQSNPIGTPVTTGADGAGTGAVTVTLDPTELAIAQASGVFGDGLWIENTSTAGFGGLRCFNDMNNSDNHENLQGVGTSDLHIYCIAYSVLPPGTYHAVTPTRLLDTRNGTGGFTGHIGNHSPITFQVTGDGVVPSNATAVTGNLTVTGQTSGGYMFIGPSPTPNPTSSTLNFPVADDRANAVTVGLGTGGTLSITFVAPSNGPSAYAIFDVTGYFTPDTTGATYHAMTPARLLDTRNGTGGISSPLGNHGVATFAVAGGGVVPAGAVAVTGNLTVTGQTSGGYLFIGPIANPNPTSSTLNFPVADDRANAVTVALGSGGSGGALGTLSVTFVAPHDGPTAQVVFDVTGYFTADLSGDFYVPVSPARILDTRNGTGGINGMLANHVAQTFSVGGQGRVATTATAVTGNLTVTGQTSGGYLFLGPNPVNNPTSSTLNFPVGDDRANAATVALSGPGGSLSVTFVAPSNGPGTFAIFDVTGYFTP